MTLLADYAQASAREQPLHTLSQLIHPIDLATFQRDHWARKPLLIRRNDPYRYADLLTLHDVDHALSQVDPAMNNIRVVVDGKETPVSELSKAGPNGATNSLEVLYERFRAGSTVVLSSLTGRWEQLQRFTQELGTEINARIQADVYLTPAEGQGSPPRYDTHDVFVAQVHGTKRWRLHGSPLALPLRNQPYEPSQPTPPVEQEFDLQPGDLLYLPRGTVHAARSNDSTSVHITIGIHPVLWADLLRDAVATVFTEDVRFREGLPIGFRQDETLREQVADRSAELLDALRAALAPADLAANAVERAVSIGAPGLRGHLTDLDALSTVTAATWVRRRPEVQYELSVSDTQVSLAFHNKTIRLPATVADEVRFITKRGRDAFTGQSIPGDLDDQGRAVLVRTLLSEGFLTLA